MKNKDEMQEECKLISRAGVPHWVQRLLKNRVLKKSLKKSFSSDSIHLKYISQIIPGLSSVQE